MDYEQLKTFVNNEIEPYLLNAEMWQCITALGIKPVKDGNQWSFLYGENIQEGICGFGDTIDEAALNFYTNLKSEKISQNVQKHSDKIETKFSEDDRIRKVLIDGFKRYDDGALFNGCLVREILAWLEKRELLTKEKALKNSPFVEHKPALSDEDGKIRKRLIERLKCMEVGSPTEIGEEVAWVEKQGKPNLAWSAEDEDYFRTTLWHLSYSISNGNDTNIHCDTTNWLSTLKDRVKSQQKREWSEDDETMVKAIIINFEEITKHYSIPSAQYVSKCKRWLKALKERYAYKPSDEQIDALKYVVNHYVPTATDTLALDALNTTELMLKQLEKL